MEKENSLRGGLPSSCSQAYMHSCVYTHPSFSLPLPPSPGLTNCSPAVQTPCPSASSRHPLSAIFSCSFPTGSFTWGSEHPLVSVITSKPQKTLSICGWWVLRVEMARPSFPYALSLAGGCLGSDTLAQMLRPWKVLELEAASCPRSLQLISRFFLAGRPKQESICLYSALASTSPSSG